MSKRDHRSGVRQRVREGVHRLAKADVGDITRPDLGKSGFSRCAEDIQDSVQLFLSLNDCDLSLLSIDYLQSINAAVTAFDDLIRRTRSFDPIGNENAGRVHTEIVQGWEILYEKVFMALAPSLALLNPVDKQVVAMAAKLASVESTLLTLQKEWDKQRHTMRVEVDERFHKHAASVQASQEKTAEVMNVQLRDAVDTWTSGAAATIQKTTAEAAATNQRLITTVEESKATLMGDARKAITEVKTKWTTIQSDLDTLRTQIDATIVDAKAARSAAQEQAAAAGVSENAIYFKNDGESHQQSSRLWLNATVALGVATLLFAIASVCLAYLLPVTDIRQAVQIVVAKVFAFSVLSLAFVWSGKNYRAHKHNQTVNVHRQNALDTFGAFVHGSRDDRIKDVVLVQASQAVFGSRGTGYDSSEPENAPTTAQLVEFAGRAAPAFKS